MRFEPALGGAMTCERGCPGVRVFQPTDPLTLKRTFDKIETAEMPQLGGQLVDIEHVKRCKAARP